MSFNQKTIIKVSLTIFLIGFILIFLIEENYELKTTKIINLGQTDINKYYKISGKIIDYNYINTSNLVFLKLKDNTSIIDVVLFKTNISFDLSQEYSVEGKITIYDGEIEMIGNKIGEN